MSTPSVAEFRVRYPEFARVADQQIALALSDAALHFSNKAWGKFYALGLQALAAHMVALASRIRPGQLAAAAVPITSKRAGDVQISYASTQGASMADTILATTAYGQRYLELRSLVSIPIWVVS